MPYILKSFIVFCFPAKSSCQNRRRELFWQKRIESRVRSGRHSCGDRRAAKLNEARSSVTKSEEKLKLGQKAVSVSRDVCETEKQRRKPKI